GQCEQRSDDAIQEAPWFLDCFASLAMTAPAGNLSRAGPVESRYFGIAPCQFTRLPIRTLRLVPPRFQAPLQVGERAEARALVFADPPLGDIVDRHRIEVMQLLAA